MATIKFTLLTALAPSIYSYQIPFSLNLDVFSTKQDYSTVNRGSHPIDLSQYANDVVLRPKKTPELVKFLSKQNIKIRVSNGAKKTADFQLPAIAADHVLLQFPLSEATVLLKDLAQAVFQLYPENYGGQPLDKYATKSTQEFQLFMENLPDSMSTKERFIAASDLFFRRYLPLSTIGLWLSMIAQTYPDIVNVQEFGHTFEKRPLKVVHCSVPSPEITEEDTRTIFVTGGIAARE